MKIKRTSQLGNVPRVGVVLRFSDLEGRVVQARPLHTLHHGLGRHRPRSFHGYCASQGKSCYGYKLRGLTSTSGVFHSYDITADSSSSSATTQKNVDGLYTRIIGKISAFTVYYINKTNNKAIGQIKHALL